MCLNILDAEHFSVSCHKVAKIFLMELTNFVAKNVVSTFLRSKYLFLSSFSVSSSIGISGEFIVRKDTVKARRKIIIRFVTLVKISENNPKKQIT